MTTTNWKTALSSNGDLMAHWLRDMTEKNTVLQSALKISHDALTAIASQTEPELIRSTAQAAIDAMTKTLEKPVT
jgi:hypothetical protein